MAGVTSIVLKVGAETAQAVSALKEVHGALDETADRGAKLQAAIGKAAVPAAAALTALGAAAVVSMKAAAAAQKSRENLDSQVKRSTGATEAAIAANEDWVSSMSNMAAVSAGEIRPALAGLVRATGDVTKAHLLMKDALNISAATGKPLASVATALQKAYNGQSGSLKRLLPSLSDGALQSGKWAKVQAELNAQVGGAAKGEAATAAGQYERMQLAIKGLQVAIGTALLPVLQAFLPMITEVFQVAAKHSQVFIVVAGAIAAVASAILVANAAIKVYTVGMQVYAVAAKAVRVATTLWTAAQWLLNAALDANPVGLIVIALAALAAGLYLAYRHSATFRAIVQGAFAAARSAVESIAGPLHAVVAAFEDLYSRSAGLRASVVNAFTAILHAIEAVAGAVGDLLGKIASIHFPSKPSWVPLTAPVGVTGLAAGGYAMPASGPIVNVTITGAIDPESTAIAIRRVLDRYDRRRGRRVLGGQGV
jgi:hypothetical protein